MYAQVSGPVASCEEGGMAKTQTNSKPESFNSGPLLVIGLFLTCTSDGSHSMTESGLKKAISMGGTQLKLGNILTSTDNLKY